MKNLRFWGIIALAVVLFGLLSIGKLVEDIDAGEIVVIQGVFDGELHVYKQAGPVWQGWGKATHYKKSNQFWFQKGKGDNDMPIAVKWNDGGHADISGSVRYDMPTNDANIIELHSRYGSQDAIEAGIIKTNVEKAVYMTGPLMTSKESYAEKRNELIYYIEDQASMGVYRTRQKEVSRPDPLTGEQKVSTIVEIQMDTTRNIPLRQETSPIVRFGMKLYNISINGITYDGNVEKQIAVQQQATMSVQTAIANAKRAEQDAITVAKQGEADAAKAKWDQEVIKATAVTKAQQDFEVQGLATKTAELYKQQQILEGEGEGAKKRLIMQANGALEQKLEAYIKVNQFYATAFMNFKGNVTPLYQSGGSGGGGNAAQNFMEMMQMKTAKDLNLDLKNN